MNDCMKAFELKQLTILNDKPYLMDLKTGI